MISDKADKSELLRRVLIKLTGLEIVSEFIYRLFSDYHIFRMEIVKAVQNLCCKVIRSHKLIGNEIRRGSSSVCPDIILEHTTVNPDFIVNVSVFPDDLHLFSGTVIPWCTYGMTYG